MYNSRPLYSPDPDQSPLYSSTQHRQEHLFGKPITDTGLFGQNVIEDKSIGKLEEISDKHTLPLFPDEPLFN